MGIEGMMLTWLLAVFCVSALAVWLLSGPLAGLAMDTPNHRSLHARAVPRTGGLGIMFAVLGGWWLSGLVLPAPLFWGALVLVLVSFADDRLDLPAGVRFAVHLAVAGWLAWRLGFAGGWLVLAVLATGWMTNLYNFMDGADGLAGGMALWGFGSYAVAFWQAGESGMALATAMVALAAVGFLLFNFPPARVFMGDGGSVPLGFLAAGFGLIGIQYAVWPAWFPWLVFAPFVVDASVTLIRRALRGDKVWQAHREHYYQRLIRMGWSHRRMALVAWALMASAGMVGLWSLRHTVWPVMAWALTLTGLMVAADRRWRQFLSNG